MSASSSTTSVSPRSHRPWWSLTVNSLYHAAWHWSKFLSPTLWLDVARWRNVDIVRRHVWQALWGIVVPPLLIYGIDYVALGQGRPDNLSLLHWLMMASNPRQLFLTSEARAFQSPSTSATTTLACCAGVTTYVAVNAHLLWQATAAFRRTWPIVRDMMTTGRSQTTEPAQELFDDLGRRGRVQSTLYYDLYLPDSSVEHSPIKDEASSRTKHQTPILFLPGAGVSHRAFCRVAHLLSNHGHIVVVVNGEPLRHVFPSLGYTATYLQRRCLAPVEQLHPHLATNKPWALVGHSMGGFCATHVASDLGASHVVMWAAAPFVTAMADLSQTKNLRVAVVQGSHDAIRTWVTQHLQPADQDWTRQFWQKLPVVHEYVVEGGTHAGFGDYTSQRFPEPQDESARRIQQEQAVQWTHGFLSQ